MDNSNDNNELLITDENHEIKITKNLFVKKNTNNNNKNIKMNNNKMNVKILQVNKKLEENKNAPIIKCTNDKNIIKMNTKTLFGFNRLKNNQINAMNENKINTIITMKNENDIIKSSDIITDEIKRRRNRM